MRRQRNAGCGGRDVHQCQGAVTLAGHQISVRADSGGNKTLGPTQLQARTRHDQGRLASAGFQFKWLFLPGQRQHPAAADDPGQQRRAQRGIGAACHQHGRDQRAGNEGFRQQHFPEHFAQRDGFADGHCAPAQGFRDTQAQPAGLRQRTPYLALIAAFDCAHLPYARQAVACRHETARALLDQPLRFIFR